MYIFFWFLIIALAAFAINMILLLSMKQQLKKKRTHKKNCTAPVLGVVLGSFSAAALLYAFTSANGTHTTSKQRAASFSIDTNSYETTSQNGQAVFSFYSTDGIFFQFDSSSLLDARTADIPKLPRTVTVYVCETCEGYEWCFLRKGTRIAYVFS